jgi:hypothetical protein
MLVAVMAGLDPAIHVFLRDRKIRDVDIRRKAGHDREGPALNKKPRLAPGLFAILHQGDAYRE